LANAPILRRSVRFTAAPGDSGATAERVLFDNSLHTVEEAIRHGQPLLSFEHAGPRKRLYFDSSKTTAAIVTCGGICPGLNDVILGIVNQLSFGYGCTRILGIRYGYEGLIPRFGHRPLTLGPDFVSTIHMLGGTILGSSRGHQNPGEMADHLKELGVDILFVIGGDGTMCGGAAITEEIQRRGLRKCVIGIPKTIDNEVMYLDKSFGFETAFAEAVKAVSGAHVEAIGAVNGIGLVKLMGRDSGFIACNATLASQQVNFCLIPEVPFALTGARGFLEALRYRIAQRKHAVIVVAEGAGQDLMQMNQRETDASGNRRLGDIGPFLQQRISEFFSSRGIPLNLKYIDPSYIIRSVPASPQDNVYCSQLAQHAVHAAMAGKTNMLVGRWHGSFVHVPFELIINRRHKVDPNSDLWHSVLGCTGQPAGLV
jgi:6-phosphofructokinase 1